MENRPGFLQIAGKLRQVVEIKNNIKHKLIFLRWGLSSLAVPDAKGKLELVGRNRMTMFYIKINLDEAIRHGIDKTHGEDIALGVSVVHAHMNTAAEVAFLVGPSFAGPDINGQFEARHGRVIEATANWLSRRTKRSKEETARILREVDDGWNRKVIK